MKYSILTKYLLLILLAATVAFGVGIIFQDDILGIITNAMMMIGIMTGMVYPYLLGIEVENRIDFRAQDGMGKLKSIVKGIVSLVIISFVVMGAIVGISVLFNMNVEYNLEITKPITMLIAGLFTGFWMHKNKIGAEMTQVQ